MKIELWNDEDGFGADDWWSDRHMISEKTVFAIDGKPRVTIHGKYPGDTEVDDIRGTIIKAFGGNPNDPVTVERTHTMSLRD